MATQDPLLAFFTVMDNRGAVIVREAPKLDLELYISNYKGSTRLDRLVFIGQHSVPLCLDALKAAIAEAKNGNAVQRYRDVWELIGLAAPDDPDAQWDTAWAERTTRENKARTIKLENELKGYKNNLVKESIRIGHRDLGEHLENIGDLAGALDAYVKMRPDASTQAHILDSAKRAINIHVCRRDWPTVLSNMNKMIGGALFSGSNEDEARPLAPFQKVTSGVALMETEKYEEAASAFLDAGDPALFSQYNHIASPNDVATYGGLLALATMDRPQLQSRVLENPTFRNYLELEPHLRKAISMFINGRYSGCLNILESYRPDYLLDIYLHKHVEAIYWKIRSKCIVQYFIPFSCVTLASLNEAFAEPGKTLEAELVHMIRSGVLEARINTVDKLLVAVSVDRRVEMQTNTLETAKQYENEALERIRRVNIAAAELEVKGLNRRTGAGGPLPGSVTDTWYEDTRMVRG